MCVQKDVFLADGHSAGRFLCSQVDEPPTSKPPASRAQLQGRKSFPARWALGVGFCWAEEGGGRKKALDPSVPSRSLMVLMWLPRCLLENTPSLEIQVLLAPCQGGCSHLGTVRVCLPKKPLQANQSLRPPPHTLPVPGPLMTACWPFIRSQVGKSCRMM